MMRRFFPSTIRQGGGGLLDGYKDDCEFAYSTRLLFSSYTGPCMRVSLNQVSFTDIDFDSNGIVDEAAILTFGGANDVFFEFYDQSGNGIDTFKLIDNLPKISIAGTIQKNGLLPSGYWNNSSFTVNTTFFTETNFVYKINTARTLGTIYFAGTSRFAYSAQQGSIATGITSGYGTPSLYKNKVLQVIANRGDVYNSIIGNPVLIEKSGNTSTWPDFKIGRQVGGTFLLDGNINDIVQYSGSQTLSRLEEISDLISTGY